MTRGLVSFAALSLPYLLAAPLQAQGPRSAAGDSAAIRRAALDYIEGWYTGDSVRMRRALHPELSKRIVITPPGERSRLVGMSSDALVRATAQGHGREGTPAERREAAVQILALDEEMASVRLLSTELVDYMHLARVDGEWRIVNVLWDYRPEHRPRATSAATRVAPAPDGTDQRPLGARLDDYLTRAAALGFSGAVTVMRGNEIVLSRGYGFANRERRIPITDHTVFDIGSVAKQFTAAAILRLEQEGRLRVADSIGRWFPNVPPDKAGITLHHLLTHTSGLARDYFTPTEFVERDSLLRLAFRAPLRRAPGSGFEYSNPGYVLLGLVVEKASGRPLERYLRETFWEPSGMASTGFALPRWNRDDVAVGYGPVAFRGTPLDQPRTREAAKRAPNMPVSPAVIYPGAGAVLSTTTDLLRWSRALDAGHVLAPAARDKLFASYADVGGGVGYGYGWFVRQTPAGTPIHAHHGTYYSYFAEFARFPAESLTIVMATNENGEAARFVRAQLQQVALGGPAMPLPAAARASAAPLASFAGSYELPSGVRFTLAMGPGGVVARAPDVRAAAALTAWPPRIVDDTAAFPRLRNIMDAMARGDFAPMRGALPPQVAAEEEERSFRRWLREQTDSLGPYAGVERLISLQRGPGVDTYAAVRFGARSVLVRFEATAPDGPVFVNASPPPVLPDQYPLVMVGQDTLAAFNFSFGTERRLRAVRDEAGRIAAVELIGGAGAPVRAERGPPSGAASGYTSAAADAATLVLRAAPAAAVRVDARLDEEVWQRAAVAESFVQRAPNPGAPATQRTEVRVAYDESAIYVAARMFDSDPTAITAPLVRRDGDGTPSDWFDVVIDSHHDRRTAFRFGVNPRGVKRDRYHSNDSAEDPTWDAVWDVATRVDSLGWVAEFRIPLAQLRYGASTGAERVWGVNFSRTVARLDELSFWSPVPPDQLGYVSRAGELHGLVGIGQPKRLELQPYLTARLARVPGTRDDPFFRPTATTASGGLDLKYGLGRGLTLTATVNPDFGQVEADPAVVNLTAFETVLPENRPFFTEGVDIFRFGSLQSFINPGAVQFFYSRRIGRAPQRNLAADPTLQYVDVPGQATILGAAKVSGRTTSGWSVGLLDAMTDEERGRYLSSSGTRGSAVVEPRSNFFLGRAKKDLNAGRTALGGILTLAHRDLGDSTLARTLRGTALVGGVDGEHSWAKRIWTVSGYATASRISGTPQAVALTQQSSARYFQRPDAEHLGIDPTRTTLGGHAFGVALRKGGDWRGSVVYHEVAPGFEANDLGIHSRADSRSLAALVGRRYSKPGPFYRDLFVRAYTSQQWNFAGDQLGASYAVRGSITSRNLWVANATTTYRARTLNDRLTRGGPLAGLPAAWQGTADITTDPRRRANASVSISTASDEAGGRFVDAELSLTMRPAMNLQVSLTPGYSREHNTAQYVRARTDALASATFGRRYVFATLDQNVAALGTRVDWTFMPTMGLQLYARPFIAAGRFSEFKELRAPRTFAFAEYGKDLGTIARGEPCGGSASPELYTIDPDGAGPAGCFQLANPDFNLRSLRGNAVLRWEYRPGSTLFFIWQQERYGEEPFGDFAVGRDVRGIFEAPAQNVFLVKATFWLGR